MVNARIATRGAIAIQAGILAPLLCLAVVLWQGAAANGFFEVSRNWLFDGYQRLFPAQRAEPAIAVIDIDAESIARIGQWPWPRDILARLVTAAGAARAIGLDILMSEPDRLSPEAWAATRGDLAPQTRQALESLPRTDDVLARAIAAAPVVLAAVVGPGERGAHPAALQTTPVFESGADPRSAMPRYPAATLPLPVLAQAAHGIGLVSSVPENDGVLRRLPGVMAIGSALVPSFAAEVVRVASGGERIGLSAGPAGAGEIDAGGHRVRSDSAGRIWLRFADPTPAQRIPAHRVLSGEEAPASFADRIVLIGVSASGVGEPLATPLRRPESPASLQAQPIASMLAGDALFRPPWASAAELVVALVLGLAATLLCGRMRDTLYAGLFGGVAALLMASSLLAFSAGGLLFDWTFPLAALFSSALATFAERIRAEVRARRLREAELATALLQAEAADRAKAEFLANTSHELRTPLNAVIGFSEAMAAQLFGPLAPNYVDYARDINRSATHLLAIISDMLDLAVMDLGGRRPEVERIDVPCILGECQRMAMPRANERRVQIRIEAGDGLPPLRADVRMTRQMILNLLSNAVKYSPEGGEVRARAQLRHDGWFGISVADQGPGIAQDDIPYVMQRFGRLRSASLAQEPGIGIGLPLTKSMIELHGGTLEIKSTLGAGTEAFLWYPPTSVERSP